MARHTGLTELPPARGYAVVYPDGVARRWNDGRGTDRGTDDVEFIRLLLDSLGRELPVDPQRIYATGISNGAGLAYRLACDLPGIFAAIAPVAGRAGGGPGALRRNAAGLADLVPGHPGSADALRGGIRASGAGQVLSATGTRGALRSGGRLRPPRPRLRASPTPRPTAPGSAAAAYAGCREGREVVLYTIEGGGHTWPGGPPVGRRVGRVSRDIDATRAMLDFFDRLAQP